MGWGEQLLNFAFGNVTYLFRNVLNGPLKWEVCGSLQLLNTQSRNHAILATTIRGHDHLCFCAFNGRLYLQPHNITPCTNSINIGQQTFLRYLLTQPRKLRVLRMFNVKYMYIIHILWFLYFWGRSDRDRMVVGFNTTYAITAYHH